MAQGRMLKKKISVNEAVASLTSDSSRLLYTWGIAHLDVDGFITGSPRGFMAVVAPLLDHIKAADIASFFEEWEREGLVVRHESKNGPCLQFPTFRQNQRGLKVNREAESKYSQSLIPHSKTTPGVIPEDSRTTPEQLPLNVKEGKLKLREGKLKKSPPPPTGGKAIPNQQIVDLWNSCKPPDLPAATLTEKRKPKIKAAWADYPDFEWWKALFSDIALSDWHSHRDKWQGNSFDWMLAKRVEMREKLDALKARGGCQASKLSPVMQALVEWNEDKDAKEDVIDVEPSRL